MRDEDTHGSGGAAQTARCVCRCVCVGVSLLYTAAVCECHPACHPCGCQIGTRWQLRRRQEGRRRFQHTGNPRCARFSFKIKARILIRLCCLFRFQFDTKVWVGSCIFRSSRSKRSGKMICIYVLILKVAFIFVYALVPSFSCWLQCRTR